MCVVSDHRRLVQSYSKANKHRTKTPLSLLLAAGDTLECVSVVVVGTDAVMDGAAGEDCVTVVNVEEVVVVAAAVVDEVVVS